jgi:hypothetical protein
MHHVRVFLGSLKPSHVSLSRIDDLELIREVNALREEGCSILSDCPHANPVCENDSLVSGGGCGDPLRLRCLNS